MVTPPTACKPCLLEKVAGSTLMLCHTFPQERPTGRSGTASAGSGKSADAEDPSFSRQISWRLGRLFTAGAGPILPTDRWFVYQTQDPRCGGPDEWIVRERDSDEAANRSSVRCYTARLVCGEARLASIQVAAARWRKEVPGTCYLHAATTNNSAETGGFA
jgi:hypothetical protein